MKARINQIKKNHKGMRAELINNIAQVLVNKYGYDLQVASFLAKSNI
jgi:hypothetical protein